MSRHASTVVNLEEEMGSLKGKTHLTWLGHSAFKIETPGNKIILIDPWLDNPKAPSNAKDISHVDMILVSHGHNDHIGNTIEIAKRTNAKVLAIYELSLYFESLGVSNVIGFGKGGTVEVDGIRVSMVDARHSGGIETASGPIIPGDAAGFVLKMENGFVLYHAGDTSLFGDMKFIEKLHKPRLVLLPIGGLYTMDPREAAVACELLKPKFIVGMHYGTFPALAGTPQQLKRHLHTKMKERVIEFQPGETKSFSR